MGVYHCAHCEEEFAIQDAGERPPCPRCGQTESVRRMNPDLIMEIRRQWFVVFGLLFVAGLAFVAFQLIGIGD